MKRYMAKKLNKRRESPELDITPFMNLMVILVPFLLITMVFSRITILDLNLPTSSNANPTPLKELQLEVTIRADLIEIGDRNIGVTNRLRKINGEYDLDSLAKVVKEIKARFPKKTDITILAEKRTDYNTLVQVMDKVRMTEILQDGKRVQVELFPNISIGDAPVSVSQSSGGNT